MKKNQRKKIQWRKLLPQKRKDKKVLCQKKIVITGSICLLLLATTGSVAWKISSKSESSKGNTAQQEGEMPSEQEMPKGQGAQMENMVSATGYASYGVITQTLAVSGLEEAVKLEGSEVTVSSGDTVKKGDAILTVTKESYDTVKENLEKACEDAENDVADAKLEYTQGKLEAQYEYLSNSSLASISLANYNNEVATLKETVANAKDKYEDAKKTVQNNPEKIAENKTKIKTPTKKLKSYEKEIAENEKVISSGEQEFNEKKQSYLVVLRNYQQILYTYQYLLTLQGQDAAEIKNILETVEKALNTVENAEIVSDTENSDTKTSQTKQESSQQSNQTQTSAAQQSSDANNQKETSQDSSATAPPDMNNSDTVKAQSLSTQETKELTISQLLANVKQEYETLTKSYQNAKTDYESIYSVQKKAADNVTSYTEKKNTVTAKITTLKETNKTLKSAYKEAKNSVEGLKASYLTALNTQVTKLVALKEEYQNDVITSEAASTTYKETLQSLEDTLNSKQETADNWKEMLKEFKKSFSDYQLVAEYEGTITGVTYAAGDVITENALIATYKDTDEVTVTVSVSQEDVGKLAVGDSAMISSSSDRYNGEILSIASSTVSESISDVSYQVVVKMTLEEEQEISTSDTLSIYFGMGAGGGKQERNQK